MGISLAGSQANDSTTDPNSLLTGGGAAPGWNGYGQPSGLIASGSTGGFAANANPYAHNINADNSAAQQYYDQGAGFSQGAPGVQNPGYAASNAQQAQTYKQQSQLAQQLQQQATDPYSSQADKQFQASAQQAQQATTALGNSTAGGLAGAAARRGAQQTNAVGAAQDVAARQQVDAQAQQSAPGQLSALYGQQGQLAGQQLAANNQNGEQNAQLQQQQQGVNNSTQLGLYGLSANEQSMSTGALTGYSNDLLGQAGASNSAQQVQQAFGNQVLGAGMSGLSSAYAGLSGGLSGGGQSQPSLSGGSSEGSVSDGSGGGLSWTSGGSL